MNDTIKKYLKQLISKYGIEICNDYRRLKGLLKDYCGEYQRDINILTTAVQEGIPNEILKTNSSELDEWKFNTLVKKLYDNHGISENFARLAVMTWAEVLGKRVYANRTESEKKVETNKENINLEIENLYNERNYSIDISIDKSQRDIVQIIAGGSHSLALKKDGTVWAWGVNNFGQLGNGTMEDSSIPVKVESLSDVVATDAGWDHSLALKKDGTVWAWGSNGSGQLGNGTIGGSIKFSSIPVKVNI